MDLAHLNLQGRVFIPGASGEPAGAHAVFALPGLDIFTSFAAGVNRLDSAMIGEATRVSGLFMSAALTTAQREGRYRHVPMTYSSAARWLETPDLFDWAIVQVSAPLADGGFSLGPCVEFALLAAAAARRRVIVVNRQAPAFVRSGVLRARPDDVIVEADAPLVQYASGEGSAESTAIAHAVAPFIQDGAALQIGLGKTPQALLTHIADRRSLRLHSGMAPEGVQDLAAAGALATDWDHCCTALLGSSEFYAWAAQDGRLSVRGVDFTHDPARLAAIDGLIAVNSALEIDLFGQCNLESAAGRAVSASGGAPDFARAARLSRGGLSIIALPSTFGARGSRVQARLPAGNMASIPRTDVDVVVTEHGAADLRGLSVHERAQALIEVAAPSFRSALRDEWREIALAL